MKQIVILTRNITAEMPFQEKLQLLGYEVFCSNMILEALLQRRNLNSLSIFKIVIFSESVSDEEVIQILSVLPENIKSFRIDEAIPEDEKKKVLEENGLHNWLKAGMTMNELREALGNIIFSSYSPKSEIRSVHLNTDKARQLVFSLSNREKQIFGLLVLANGETLPRNEICNRLWKGKVNNSTLTQLSQFIKHIRSKMERHKIDKELLGTEWRSGYFLSAELISQLDAEAQEVLMDCFKVKK